MFTIDLKNLNITGLSTFALNYLPPLVAAGFIVGVSQNLAVVTWSTMPTVAEEPAPIEQTKDTIARTNQRQQDGGVNINQLSNWHLFGEAKQELPKNLVVAPPPTEVKDAPDTTLRLTLMGVMASRNMRDAWAIIGDRSGNEENYRVDSSLPGGATLKEIHADRVILLHNGRFETLRLPKDSLPEEKSASSNRSSRSTVGRSASRRSTSNRQNQSVTQVSAEATQTLREYRSKLINDPQSVMNAIRAEPYRQAGQLKGYRIFPGRDKDLFQQIGLEPGDVVISINGIALDNPIKGLEVMQNVTEATEISMDVIRNGVNQTFTVPLN